MTAQLLAAAMSIPVAVLIVWAVMEAIDIFLNRLSDPFDQSVAAEEARHDPPLSGGSWSEYQGQPEGSRGSSDNSSIAPAAAPRGPRLTPAL